MNNIFYGIIRELAFKPDNQRSWMDFLEGNDKKKVILEVREDKPTRTLDQNAFYWCYLDVIEKDTGNLATDLHELFKRKFLPPIPKSIMGVEFKMPASTKKLTKQEFSEYMDKISAFTEIEIPEPIKKEFQIESVNYPINSLGEQQF